jgi:hypothetical protein
MWSRSSSVRIMTGRRTIVAMFVRFVQAAHISSARRFDIPQGRLAPNGCASSTGR